VSSPPIAGLHHCLTLPALRVLAEELSLGSEAFASPCDVTGVFASWFSPDRADTALGSRGDFLSPDLSGGHVSAWANPPVTMRTGYTAIESLLGKARAELSSPIHPVRVVLIMPATDHLLTLCGALSSVENAHVFSLMDIPASSHLWAQHWALGAKPIAMSCRMAYRPSHERRIYPR
jgi:hypothetical protein